MKHLLFTLSLVLVTSFSFSSERPDHELFTKLLQKHVSADGKVNYKGFMDDIDAFDEYLVELRMKAPVSDWSSAEKKAFYLNAYNAYTIKFIITKYPVKSPKDVKFSGKEMWEFRMVQIGPQKYSLNQVEDNILRRMNDPRIHFAINCGALSCPKLLNEAYTADKINSQLTKVTKAFIKDEKFNELKAKKIKVSKIFEWYAEDFKDEGGVIGFINKYADITVETDAKIEYLEYDWTLNEQ
ncbi:DUF547 domain-containing protein [Paracrocinitomix mangrovi]|uniref:DUF547 domain-containing protein n=1 Tax=Paracrocinitomix mangrovi TaxID=2862509 RepID=UPI001C8DAA2D|nr:DUF547 domain-containing protein [Paracrocinitomix mangrovi]UKN01683.1 DUF547 domain-containing protein [Paracrocinitomix mangrovi]